MSTDELRLELARILDLMASRRPVDSTMELDELDDFQLAFVALSNIHERVSKLEDGAGRPEIILPPIALDDPEDKERQSPRGGGPGR
ncbi:MAG: hypothetical protein ACYTDU_18350 [Planctomycetota bacterium]